MALFRFRLNMWIKLFLLVFTALCFSATGEQSFTPSKIQFRVESIVLSTAMSGGLASGDKITLYECTSGDCFLTLTDNNLLSSISKSQEIKTGSYRYLTVTSCSGNAVNFVAKIKGSVTIGGTNYYSHATEGLFKQEAVTPEEDVDLTFTQCKFHYELQSDLVITDSQKFPLTLFMDLKNVAWGREGVQTMESGCFQGGKGSDDTVFSVCMGVPHMIPVPTTTNPILMRFHIHNVLEVANTAGGMIVILVDSSDTVLGGFSRRIFSATSKLPSVFQFDMALKRMLINSSGSYEMSTYGTSFDSTFLTFSQFSLNSHSGETYAGSNGLVHAYTAVKQ